MTSKDEKARRKQMKDAYLRDEQAASAALLPLDRPQLEALLDHVDPAVVADGCVHTFRATDAWAEANGVDLVRLHQGLEEYGAYCDCEVIMNINVRQIFEPTRQAPDAS